MKTYSLLIYLCDILQMPTNITRRPVHSSLMNADLEHGLYLCLKLWNFHYYYSNSWNYKMIKTLKQAALHISGHGKQLSTNKHIFNFVETLKKLNISFSTTQYLLVFKDTSVCVRQLKHEKHPSTLIFMIVFYQIVYCGKSTVTQQLSRRFLPKAVFTHALYVQLVSRQYYIVPLWFIIK